MEQILLTFTEFFYSVLVEHNEYTKTLKIYDPSSLQLFLHNGKM